MISRRIFKTVLLSAMIFFAVSPAYSKQYSMEEYLGLVKENNKDLMLAASSLKNAGEQEKLARSQALPTVGLSSSLYRNFIDVEQQAAVASQAGGGPLIYKKVDVNKDYDFSFGLGLSQQLFNMNVFNAIRASKEYKQMSKSVYDAQSDAILTAAKKVFFQCYLLEKLYNVRKETEERSYDHYMLMKQKYDAGVVSNVALLNAEVDYKKTIPQTTNAKMNLELCLINLKHLAGIPEDEEVSVIGDFTVYPEIPETLSMQDVLEDRSDYMALLREKSLRELNVKATQAGHYPTLSLDAAYGYSNSDDKFTKAFHNDNYTQIFKVGLKLELPIFTGGALSAKDHQVKIESEQTEIKLQQKREDIIVELRQIYLTLQMEFENIATAESTIDTAKEAYDIAQVSFDNGVMTQLELRDTRLNLEGAELNHLNAVYNYLSAYFDWQKATGNM